MKQIVLLLFMCFATIASNAQQKADIEVSYTAHQPDMKTGNEDCTCKYILLANGAESKFFSPRTEYVDSLNSTSDGKAKYNEMMRHAFFGGNVGNAPTRAGSYYVLTDHKDKKVRYYDKAGSNSYFYEEDLPKWDWAISDSSKIILGYECIMATTDFHGRKWAVWFSPELPLNVGPWKLCGLPGLILEAASEDGRYSFIADGIQETNKEITPIYLSKEYEKTDRVSFLKAKRSFLDNPLGQIMAQFGDIKIDTNSEKVGFASRETVDFIETDY